MYVSSCPLRVSLFGGSTDNPYFVEKNGYGSVISFTCDLKTYITFHEDKIGYNKEGNKYIINYSKREEVESTELIQNELVKVVLEYFGVAPSLVSMTSDAYSQGSGLASSSSYIISLIKCISMSNDLHLTDIEICEIAYKLEREFNPYCGYQDPYGCGIGGFKRIEFQRGGIIKYDFLSTELFKYYDAHLIFTGVTRNSKKVLKDISCNLDKISPLLDTLEKAYDALLQKEYEEFLIYLNESWKQKKETSSMINENQKIMEIDEHLINNPLVISHKLCGAGNGGFFLTFSEKNKLTLPFPSIKINVSLDGVKGKKL
jgi:D-glycero-alpha-D-manno-heptose-7-phosphate kinase